MSLQVPYPPPRVTFLDIAGLVANYREHSYLRWFLVCDGQPNSASLARSYSMPNGTARLGPSKPRKEPAIPPAMPGDPNPVSPVRHRYMALESPSRVRARSEPRTELPGVDPHELRFRYDARLKGYEEQVAGLKSSVKQSDLTRTQRRLQYLDYRTDDPVVQWARRKCRTMQTTYTDARAKVESAMAAKDVSTAAKAFASLERTITVEDEFMRMTRSKITEMANHRSELLEQIEAAIKSRKAGACQEVHEAWPYAHDDVGLNAAREFLEQYQAAKAQLLAVMQAAQQAEPKDWPAHEPALERQMSSWMYSVDDIPFQDAQKVLDHLRGDDLKGDQRPVTPQAGEDDDFEDEEA